MELTGSVDYGANNGSLLWGFGANLNLVWSVGKKNDALVGIIGVDRLYEDFESSPYTHTFALGSFGYRKVIKSFFIEPKIGAGLVFEPNYSDFCAFIGVEPGFQTRRFTFSVDYRFITVDGAAFGDRFHTFAAKVGYRIFRK